MDKVITATGKSFSCDYFNPFEPARQLTIRIIGATLVEVATVFSDPRETVQLWWNSSYESMYTRVIAIVPEANAIRVVLGKE